MLRQQLAEIFISFVAGSLVTGTIVLGQTLPMDLGDFDLLVDWYATMAACSTIGGFGGVALWCCWRNAGDIAR